jgi:hypothetical protein
VCLAEQLVCKYIFISTVNEHAGMQGHVAHHTPVASNLEVMYQLCLLFVTDESYHHITPIS